ncbi:MAG: hypothetical protein GWP75_05845 [Planctomycetia bacterium]|jgi:anti-sigma28 factor (negative regulator of flagellin synthesis)|nr:hypothetical protein [Planctomycetia bacterium]
MSDIANIAGNRGSSAARLQRPDATESSPRPQESKTDRFGRRSEDAVELSAQARRYAGLQTPTTESTGRIATIQSQIAAGTYDTEERLGAAVDRMIDHVLS